MTRTRRGFTLIELLIVVVIIGILAAIAIPKFADTKKKAYITAMKTDLKNLVPAGEALFSETGSYATFPASPNGSSGVTLVVTNGATGWSAKATHNAADGAECYIYVGSPASIPGNLTAEGAPGGPNCK